MVYDMLTVRRRRLNVVNLEAITTYSGSLFHRAITRTGKEFVRSLINSRIRISKFELSKRDTRRDSSFSDFFSILHRFLESECV